MSRPSTLLVNICFVNLNVVLNMTIVALESLAANSYRNMNYSEFIVNIMRSNVCIVET